MRRRTRKQPRTGADDSEAPDFSTLDLTVGHLTRVVQVRLFQLYYERLRHLKISPGAFSALTALRANPGIQHGPLTAALAAHGPNVTKLIDQLVRAGWVERRKLPGDRRATGHFLTPRGQAKAASIFKLGLAHDRRATSALSARERATLLRLLAKLDRSLGARSIDGGARRNA